MIDAVPVTPWDMFKTLLTGTSVAEFNVILFKASRKCFEFIQADFNEKIYLTDESSNGVKSWKGKKKRKS